MTFRDPTLQNPTAPPDRTFRDPTIRNPQPRPLVGDSAFKFTSPTQQGMSQLEYDRRIRENEAALGEWWAAGGSGGGASNANAMEALRNQLKFGLERVGLDREQVGLGREGLGLNREELALNRRNDLEGVINNALQRGIYRSGIRIRNERRVNERADLAGERVDLAERGLDVTGKRIDLSEKELRARIDNALEGLRASAAAANKSRDLAAWNLLQQLRTATDQAAIEAGGVFPTVGREVDFGGGKPFGFH